MHLVFIASLTLCTNKEHVSFFFITSYQSSLSHPTLPCRCLRLHLQIPSLAVCLPLAWVCSMWRVWWFVHQVATLPKLQGFGVRLGFPGRVTGWRGAGRPGSWDHRLLPHPLLLHFLRLIPPRKHLVLSKNSDFVDNIRNFFVLGPARAHQVILLCRSTVPTVHSMPAFPLLCALYTHYHRKALCMYTCTYKAFWIDWVILWKFRMCAVMYAEHIYCKWWKT